MTKDLARLKALAALANLIRDRDLSILAAAQAARADLQQRSKQLTEEQQVRIRHLQSQAEPDLALRSGADERWQAFLRQRQQQIARDLARQSAVCEDARSVARIAVGRAEALRRLTQRGKS